MKKSCVFPGSLRVRLAWKMYTLVILVLFASACSGLTGTIATQDTKALYTAAAQTLMVDMTLEAGNTAIALLTELARTPVAPPPTSTRTPEPSPTLSSPTPTSLSPSPTSTSPPCDWAEFVGDVTVSDNTSFPIGANFSKIWRIRNIGSCSWSSDYDLVFSGGDLLGAIRSLPLPGVVMPGETIDLAVDLRAPAAPGAYRGEWMLRGPSGNIFGISSNAQEAFWVQIQVYQISSRNQYAYDFVSNYCLADWSNGGERLNCPGNSTDTEGFIVLVERPEFESRVENEPALWTRPARGREGWIIGEYPSYVVEDGDHFITEIGCLYDSPDCDVRFQLDYRTPNGVVRNLGAWREIYDSTTTFIDLDLSSLEDRSVRFILSVNNLGNFQDANAFWFVPHLRNDVVINQVALIWRQTKDDDCNQLEIYLSSRKSGTANAYFCQERSKYLGSTNLNSNELDQMLGLYDRLLSFNAEVSSAGSTEMNHLVFSGGGKNDAASADIELLSSLAENLFNSIAH